MGICMYIYIYICIYMGICVYFLRSFKKAPRLSKPEASDKVYQIGEGEAWQFSIHAGWMCPEDI